MMYMSFSPPVAVFFFSILLGFCIGVFWDINRVLKGIIAPKGRKFIFVLDVVFCVIAYILTTLFFLCFTYGGFRLFVLVGAFLGFIMFYCTIEKFVFYLLNILIGFIFKVAAIIIKFIKALSDKLSIILGKLYKFTHEKYFKIINKIKNRKNTCANGMDKCIMKELNKFIKKNNLQEK